MRSTWYFLLIFSLSKCIAWETTATSEALSALIDKLIAQTDIKPAKEDTNYRKSENNNGHEKIVNDSNVIYLKVMPNDTYNLTLQPNATVPSENNSYPDNEREGNDLQNDFIERNIQKLLNSEYNKENIKKILHDIKYKIGKNKPEKETEHKLRISDIENSNKKDEPLADKNTSIRSGFDLFNNPPDIILSKKTIVLKDDDKIEKIIPDILTSVKKQSHPTNEKDIKDLLKNILEVKQMKNEKLSPIEHIPSRRRYSSNEVTTDLAPRNNIISPSLLGSLDISKTVQNYLPSTLCGNCKQLGLVNVPLNNIFNNNARLQGAMRRSLIGNLVRPSILYKHFNGIFK